MSTSPAHPVSFDEQVMAVADVYAAALMEAAEAHGQLEEVAAEFADLLVYMRQEPDFAAFLTADSVDDEPRRASLEKLFRGRMNDLLLNLLHVLNDRGRASLVPAVGRCVELRMEERRQQQEIVVRSAAPLSDHLREQIQRDVSAYMGKEALLIEQVAPELIGGLVLQIGDVQVDASVLSRLHTMHKRLLDRATREVHASGRHVIEG
ncbi:MAG: hypothetical protein AMXMBFR13_33420 [Phycisphaerae bacterium]